MKYALSKWCGKQHQCIHQPAFWSTVGPSLFFLCVPLCHESLIAAITPGGQVSWGSKALGPESLPHPSEAYLGGEESAPKLALFRYPGGDSLGVLIVPHRQGLKQGVCSGLQRQRACSCPNVRALAFFRPPETHIFTFRGKRVFKILVQICTI